MADQEQVKQVEDAIVALLQEASERGLDSDPWSLDALPDNPTDEALKLALNMLTDQLADLGVDVDEATRRIVARASNETEGGIWHDTVTNYLAGKALNARRA